MKKLIIWLAKIFDVNITKEVIVEKEVEKIVYKDRIVEVQVALDNEVIKGTCTVQGNLIVEGVLTVTGEVTCYKIKGE